MKASDLRCVEQWFGSNAKVSNFDVTRFGNYSLLGMEVEYGKDPFTKSYAKSYFLAKDNDQTTAKA